MGAGFVALGHFTTQISLPKKVTLGAMSFLHGVEIAPKSPVKDVCPQRVDSELHEVIRMAACNYK